MRSVGTSWAWFRRLVTSPVEVFLGLMLMCPAAIPPDNRGSAVGAHHVFRKIQRMREQEEEENVNEAESAKTSRLKT